MQFQQSQLTRSTQFTVREHGFFVSQRDGRGQVDIAVEIPYEELLPIRLEYRNQVPRQMLPLAAFAFIFWILHLARPWLDAGRLPVTDDVLANSWLLTMGAGVCLLMLSVYAWRHWWHQAILHTGRLQLVLADHPRDRQQFRDFTQRLDAHTKAYLRQEYGAINPLGYIEPQLRRVAWLRDLGVLSVAEARTLNTRLTGRVSERSIRSMGQRLEPLYVN
ncbi:hypothetical protein FNT36_20705 [Hymenobacter setariae]|uniref:Uncharacterized protein n=1 Tax=Hymenobacter setariae TaxID=2594794 RepID=A0A558BPZ9_9BACT|nr:hypothetical protein [Hymenobacter setariae]TVT38604.1 hypothetical protein FNT36_20705 [Hymenobacter setariae]